MFEDTDTNYDTVLRPQNGTRKSFRSTRLLVLGHEFRGLNTSNPPSPRTLSISPLFYSVLRSFALR